MSTQLLVLQPINLCNLNCRYCYVPGRRDSTKMSDSTLENTIRCIFSSSCIDRHVTLVFHAGEPLAVGIEFYERALFYINKYNNRKIEIKLCIQSNGTLINDKWCDFFKKYNIDITISIDGPKFLNDSARVDWRNKGSFSRVMRGINTLRRNDIPLSAICVLTDKSLDYPEEIYQFFSDEGFSSLCINTEEIEGINEASSFHKDGRYKLSDDVRKKHKWFISKLYDLWISDNCKIGYVREFSRIEEMLRKKRKEPSFVFESSEVVPLNIITITKEGNVSTFSPELSGGTKDNLSKFHIGNVNNISCFEDLLLSKKYIEMNSQISKGVKKCLSECEYFGVCGGGSPSNKYYEHGTFNASETAYCVMAKKDLTDVIISKRKVDYLYSRLQKGISVISNLDLENRFKINNGTNFCTQDQKYIRQHAADTAFFPNESWRELTAGEYSRATYKQKTSNSHTHIYLGKLTSSQMNDFLQTGVSEVESESACEEFIRSSRYEALEAKLMNAFTPFLKQGETKECIFIRPMTCYPPGRTTLDVVHKEFSGMHIDRWDKKLKINELSKGRNRVVINLGNEARFFVYVNLTYYQLLKSLSADSIKRQFDGMVDFFVNYPEYPILRIKINPGEYYVAPVGNFLHDGYTLTKSQPDKSISLIGHFDISKLLLQKGALSSFHENEWL